MHTHWHAHTMLCPGAYQPRGMSCRCAHTARSKMHAVLLHTRTRTRCRVSGTMAHAHGRDAKARCVLQRPTTHTHTRARCTSCHGRCTCIRTRTCGRDACRVTVDAHVYAHVHGRDRCRVKLHAHECMLGGAYSRPGVPARRTLPSDSHRLLKARGHSIQHLREFLITQAAAVQAGSEVRRLCVMHRDEHR